jgi:hypothetical protein
MDGRPGAGIKAMNSPSPGGPRQAALTLHALPAEDRQWVFERLEPRQRQLLQPLLEELAELAFPRDRELIDLALKHPATEPAQRPASDRLAAASAQQVGALLKGEPPGLIAHLTAARAWPWANALRQTWDAPLREQVTLALRNLPPTSTDSRLVDWLIDDLTSRLAADVQAASGAQAAARSAGNT